MDKYVITVILVPLLVGGRIPLSIDGMRLNCLNMSTIEGYTEYAGWCPYVWPYNSIYTRYADITNLNIKEII